MRTGRAYFDRRGFGAAYYSCVSRSSNGLTCKNCASYDRWFGRFKGYRTF